MMYRDWQGFCLCSEKEEYFPCDSVPVPVPHAPLVLLVQQLPLSSRGLYAIRQPEELTESAGLQCLLPCRGTSPVLPAELKVCITEHGATVLNVAFGNAFRVLKTLLQRKTSGLHITLAGLGDVGGTVLTGLKLLGHEISEISIFDPYAPLCQRYEMELNQILPLEDGQPMPQITVCSEERLFDCDVFIFTASCGVPPLNSGVQDVRMAQYEANRALLHNYAQKARQANFHGLFCQISDPVDHLARSVFLSSNQYENGTLDFSGFLPEQVQGFGLGVMAARAAYMAQKACIDFSHGRLYGPHGAGLVVANSCGSDYNDDLSRLLTAQTVQANLMVRELGFKPYIAPGLSSAAISILRMLRGEIYYGAAALGSCYFGCREQWTENGPSLLREPICPPLLSRMENTYRSLKEFPYE